MSRGTRSFRRRTKLKGKPKIGGFLMRCSYCQRVFGKKKIGGRCPKCGGKLVLGIDQDFDPRTPEEK